MRNASKPTLPTPSTTYVASLMPVPSTSLSNGYRVRRYGSVNRTSFRAYGHHEAASRLRDVSEGMPSFERHVNV